MATYTPLTPRQARSRVANSVQAKHPASAISRARADLAVANVARAIDTAVATGVSLDQDQAEYLAAYLADRFSLPAVV